MELQLRKLRRSKHLTQEELGLKIGQTARVLGAWEREETALPIDDAARIADVLECTLDELAGREFHPDQADTLTSDEGRLIGLYRDANAQGRAAIDAVATSTQGMGAASNPGRSSPSVKETA